MGDGLQTSVPTPGPDDVSLGAPTPVANEGEEAEEDDYSTDDTDALERDLEAQMQAAEQEEEDESDESDEDALERDLFGGGQSEESEEDEEEVDNEMRDIKRRINLAKDKIRETEPIVESKKRDVERSTNRIMMVRLAEPPFPGLLFWVYFIFVSDGRSTVICHFLGQERLKDQLRKLQAQLDLERSQLANATEQLESLREERRAAREAARDREAAAEATAAAVVAAAGPAGPPTTTSAASVTTESPVTGRAGVDPLLGGVEDDGHDGGGNDRSRGREDVDMSAP
jgi:hypothetical protein